MSPQPPRPKLAAYLEAREIDHFQAAALIGCSGEYVRRMCLAFDDPRRCVPSRRMKARIEAKTDGVIGLEDWSQPLPVAA